MNTYEMDIIFFKKYRLYNDKYDVIFIAINIYSRYAFCYALKDPEQETLIKDFLKDKISDNSIIDEIVYIACNTSLSKEVANIHNIDKNNINLKCVQDADRIDSLGSIGICRYFMYGIHKNKSKINDIITNIKNRSKIVLKFIKTKYGRKIAKRKYKIIHKFIKNYKKDLKI